jgi:7,8-dihydropterin-6-yl-methyl-4-(beta-D-ribofuranosyl)aminobenzene 5'-phosphate synthase
MKTIEYFEEKQIKDLAPCHCVSFSAKVNIRLTIPIKKISVGLIVDWH